MDAVDPPVVETLVAAVGRVNAFVDDLRAEGIHVGVNGRCAACGAEWPCSIGDEAMQALRAGAQFVVDLDAGMSTEEALEAAVARGWMERAGVDDAGEQLYRLTTAGTEMVENMAAGNTDECSPPTG